MLRAALAHYQFETLHPYGDGNGRVGRLVIVLQLMTSGSITHPAVTISPWLYAHRDEYQSHLFNVSRTGDCNPWVRFFCRAIEEQCRRLHRGAEELVQWLTDTKDRVNQNRWTGRIYQVLTDLTQWPVISIAAVTDRYRVTTTAATNIVNHLVTIGAVSEITGRTYGRVFGATEVMRLVDSI